MVTLSRTEGSWQLDIVKSDLQIRIRAPELASILSCIRSDTYRSVFNGERIIIGKIAY